MNDEAQKWLDMYEERAAIIQFDGGYSRDAAEQFASEEVMDIMILAKKLPNTELINIYRKRFKALILRRV